jgi:hypothetical protein
MQEKDQNMKSEFESDHGLGGDDPNSMMQEEGYADEYAGIFNPEIDQILWKRDKVLEDGTRSSEFLVKFKEYSYMHCDWMDEADLLNTGKNIKNKLNRFNKTFEKKLMDFVRVLSFFYLEGGVRINCN